MVFFSGPARPCGHLFVPCLLVGISFLLPLHPVAGRAAEPLQAAIPDSIQAHWQTLSGEERVQEMVALAQSSIRRDINLSRTVLQEAVSYSQDIGYETGVAAGYNGLGAVHHITGDFSTALEYFEQALGSFERQEDQYGQANALHNIAYAQRVLGLGEAALVNEQRSLEIRQTLGEEALVATSLSAIGATHQIMGNLGEALTFALRSLRIRRELNDEEGTAIALGAVAVIQDDLGLHLEAQVSCEEAIVLSRKSDDRYGLGFALNNLGGIALSLEQWDTAILATEEALLLGQELDARIIIKNAHENLALAFEGKNQDALALEHFRKFQNLKDELFSEEISERVAALTASVEAAGNRSRLLELERDNVAGELELAEKRRQRDIFLVGFSLSLPLAILVFVLFRRSQAANRMLSTQSAELATALASLRILHGLIPICASCKNIRDDKGYWHQVETYVTEHSHAEFTHGICPDCIKTNYGADLEVME